MSKVALSATLAIVLGGAVVAGLNFLPSSSGQRAASDETAAEVAALRKAIEGLRKDLGVMGERIDELASAQPVTIPTAPAPRPAGGETAPGGGGGILASDLHDIVFAVIQEERRVREETEQQRREEMRQQMEERRKELEELSQGPYDRYNLRVNSMGKALELTDAQKEGFFELTKKYSEKFGEARKTLMAARQDTEGQAEGGRGRRGGGPGGERGEQYRELVENLQKEYEAELGTILTGTQLETFNGLSDRSQSFMNSGMVSTGDDDGGVRGFFGGAMRDAFGGGAAGARGTAAGGGMRGRGGGGRGGR